MRGDRHPATRLRSALRRRVRRRSPRRRVPPAAVAPTLCTLANLVAGFAAIHYAAKPADHIGPWGWTGLTFAGVLIFVGMFFDAIDGTIARLTRSTTELGAQLDSLADVVTFGVAPAFMTIALVGAYLGDDRTIIIIGPEADNMFGRVIWGVAATYICCAALRLARFNVETPSASAEDHRIFRGLPSPGAAGAVASLILLHQHLASHYAAEVSQTFVRATALGIPFVTLLCALGMVSTLPYTHIVNRYLRGRRSFRYIVYMVVPLVLLVWHFHLMVAIAFCAYAMSAPVQKLLKRTRRAMGHSADQNTDRSDRSDHTNRSETRASSDT